MYLSRKLLISLFLFVGLSFGSSFTSGQVIVDPWNQSVTIPEHPKRVVTLAPSLAEMVIELFGTDLSRWVGSADRDLIPGDFKQVVHLGSYQQLNLERILALQPDLVIATSDGNSKEQIARLKELGISVVVTRVSRLSEIAQSLEFLGQCLGLRAKATQVAQGFLRRLGQTKGALGKKNPRVLIQLADRPLVVAGKDSFLNDALLHIGGRNVYGDSRDAYPRPSLEDVLMRDPEVILILTFGEELRTFERMREGWMRFSGLSAVKNSRILILRSDELLRPSPGITRGLEKLVDLLGQGAKR